MGKASTVFKIMRYVIHYKKFFFLKHKKISKPKEIEIEKTELAREITIEEIGRLKLLRKTRRSR